jgi:hypothetical protein
MAWPGFGRRRITGYPVCRLGLDNHNPLGRGAASRHARSLSCATAFVQSAMRGHAACTQAQGRLPQVTGSCRH